MNIKPKDLVEVTWVDSQRYTVTCPDCGKRMSWKRLNGGHAWYMHLHVWKLTEAGELESVNI